MLKLLTAAFLLAAAPASAAGLDALLSDKTGPIPDRVIMVPVADETPGCVNLETFKGIMGPLIGRAWEGDDMVKFRKAAVQVQRAESEKSMEWATGVAFVVDEKNVSVFFFSGEKGCVHNPNGFPEKREIYDKIVAFMEGGSPT